MKIDGACHCGFITFEAEADPEKVVVCNCTDCQTLSGAPLRAAVIVDADKFHLLSGEPAVYVKVAESGNERAQTFCPRCGSPLYATEPGNPDAPRMIRLGGVRQRHELTPKKQVWTASRQTWVSDLDSIPGIEKQ